MPMILGLYKEQYDQLKKDNLIDYLFEVVSNRKENIHFLSIENDFCWSNTPQKYRYWSIIYSMKHNSEKIWFDKQGNIICY